eukprot:COSAG02_NODE_18073_length_962_cov_3320.523754_1_plen_82_part_10
MDPRGDSRISATAATPHRYTTVALALRAHFIQSTPREIRGVLLLKYSVYNAARLVKMFGNTHIRCAKTAKTTVAVARHRTHI